MSTFQQILERHQQTNSLMNENLRKAVLSENKKILEAVSAITVEHIVKGLAELQLEFRNTSNGLSQKILTEVSKSDALQRAIEIQNQQLQELHEIRITAENLTLLKQVNSNKMKTLAEESEAQLKTWDQEIAAEKYKWQMEQQEFDSAQQTKLTLLKKERETAEADFNYKLERKRKFDADDYETKKKLLTYRLSEESKALEEKWQEREKIIADKQQELETNKAKAKSLAEEILQEAQKAKEQAMKEVEEQARIEATLLEKEIDTNKEAFTLQVKTLEETIQQQNEHLKNVSQQLQAALKQVQELTIRTIDSTKTISRSVDKKGAN